MVIVDGVGGGVSSAAQLRRLDEAPHIVMFERGKHNSFANCGLPYYVELETNMDGVFAVGNEVQVVDFVNGNESRIPLESPANK